MQYNMRQYLLFKIDQSIKFDHAQKKKKYVWGSITNILPRHTDIDHIQDYFFDKTQIFDVISRLNEVQ